MFELALAGSTAALTGFRDALCHGGVPARTVESAADLGRADVLFLMPSDVQECEELLFEHEGFARMPEQFRTIIISATLSPRYVRALRNRISASIALVDAPPIGTARAVAARQGSFLLGGPQNLLDELRPLFTLIGRGQNRMGEFGTATAAKALQDCITAASSAMTRSALGWAEAQGIEETGLLSFLKATLGQQLPLGVSDPAQVVTNTLPGDNAGAALVRDVESALDAALAGVHLNPPRSSAGPHPAAGRSRHLH